MENTVKTFKDTFREWRDDVYFDEQTRKELSALDEVADAVEIEDRFYTRLEFGTGGLRGVMGAGTNRMNRYTVGLATYGLGLYLINEYGKEKCAAHGVVIACDTRNNSRYFAETVADVLSGMGVLAIVHTEPRPTPQLSFSVKHFGALAGVVITASHNPKEYNGYKVYDSDGCQLVPHQAEKVLEYINGIEDFKQVSYKRNPDFVKTVDVTDEFVSKVLEQSRFSDNDAKKELKIVYTPLHGTGSVPVKKALSSDGFENVSIVKAQDTEDGNFPTVVSPNPEDRRALELGIEQAKDICADIVLGTDPDCDRVGVAVRKDDGYVLLTGNQTGALLMDYVLENTNLENISNPAIVKTTVTSELGAEIALKKGVSVFTTLTGFKYIGEKINQFEKANKEKDSQRNFTYLFGYEESYGYLCGTHARDKDAAVSAMLICEMAASLKKQGKTPIDRLEELYSEYGYYLDALDSFTLKGKDGLEKISGMMKKLREEGVPFADGGKTTDYLQLISAEEGFGYLPKSDVIKYMFTDGSWIAVRPSGTEPKIKIYYSIKEKNKADAEIRLDSVRQQIKEFLNLA